MLQLTQEQAERWNALKAGGWGYRELVRGKEYNGEDLNE